MFGSAPWNRTKLQGLTVLCPHRVCFCGINLVVTVGIEPTPFFLMREAYTPIILCHYIETHYSGNYIHWPVKYRTCRLPFTVLYWTNNVFQYGNSDPGNHCFHWMEASEFHSLMAQVQAWSSHPITILKNTTIGIYAVLQASPICLAGPAWCNVLQYDILLCATVRNNKTSFWLSTSASFSRPRTRP